jgi:signal transduction histidine kinase
MTTMHKLLERQLRKFGPLPPECEGLIAAIDSAYAQADRDREMIQRSLELASHELLERNRQLREDIECRKRLEVELAQADKLRAVGQLASGIAHELNTPIQYVGDNVAFLQTAFETLSTFIARARDESTSPAERRKLAFMATNIPGAIEAAVDGCRRVSEIVGAMKEFAHPAGVDFAPADINRGITCTLAVAQNAIKYAADVELHLGELPEVECRIGELNQVLLNLITNAAHAVADKHAVDGARGRIGISTYRWADRVVIQVSDDGCGIPEAIRGRIFEPFFTTKEVGRGTGQGLAICRSIVVDKHRGTLTFESTPGQGTTFTLEIPIAHRSAAPAGSLRAVAAPSVVAAPSLVAAAAEVDVEHGRRHVG